MMCNLCKGVTINMVRSGLGFKKGNGNRAEVGTRWPSGGGS